MSRVALIPDRIFTGTGAPSESGACVVVDGPLIERIVPSADAPPGIERIEMPGCTLLPGFIDTHVHVDGWELPLFLAYGVTTVRDVGNNLEWILRKARELDDPGAAGPFIVPSGPLIDCREYRHSRISWGMGSTEDVKDAVAVLHRAGIRFVKLYWSLTDEMYDTAIRAARDRGMHTLADLVNVRLGRAIDLGLHEFEHFHGTPNVYDEELVDRIADRGVWAVPTIMVYASLIDFQNDTEARALDHFAPPKVRAYWRFHESRMFGADCMPTADHGRLVERVELNRTYLRALIGRGARIAIGTDAPCTNHPGHTFYREMKELVDGGFDTARSLVTATATGAELLGISEIAGTIEPGKRADLCVFEGNPFEDFSVLRKLPVAVYKAGHRYDPAVLLERHAKRVPRDETLDFKGEGTTVHENWRDLVPRHLLG